MMILPNRSPARPRQRARRGVSALALLAALACSDPAPVTESPVGSVATPATGRMLRIGDVDPNTPARRTRRLEPLAEYLAAQLADLGIAGGQVIIAQDLSEMARLLRDGEVDLYLDSAYPVLLVGTKSHSEVLLQRWAKGAPDYWSLFITSQDSGISSLDDLRGSLIAFQDRYSTSGFVLPAGTLIELGFELREVSGTEQVAEVDVVHYLFSHDEENTIEMVITGRAPAGTISNQDWDELPAEMQSRLRIIDRTPAVPRQLLAARADLETELVVRARAALLALAGPEASPVTLENSPDAWTWKFDPVSPEAATEMQRMTDLIRLLKLE